jgi:hypothetical protein
MWPFTSQKRKTLSHAVLAGDIRSVRRMLDQGANPNNCDPGDDAYPIHYALNHGPEMVQLLVNHGADVNIPCPRNNAMPLAFAEAHAEENDAPWEGYPFNTPSHMRAQYAEVASILRKAGARLRTGREEFIMDPRLRLQLEPKIRYVVLIARVNFPTESPEQIAERVEEKVNLEFPQDISRWEQEGTRSDLRALIQKECGVKNYQKTPIPSVEQAKRTTGMSEDELTRRFMEHLIQQGLNPFAEMPKSMLRDANMKFPDLVQLARRKFGTNR